MRPDHSKRIRLPFAVPIAAILIGVTSLPGPAWAANPSHDLNTLAGKVAALRGTAGLQIRFSGLIEQEAEEEDAPTPGKPRSRPRSFSGARSTGTRSWRRQ